MTSITADREKKRKIRIWAVVVWLLIWQAVSMWIGQEILLVSPVAVLLRLLELIRTKLFWQSIGFSVMRIVGGFLLAMFLSVIGAWKAACGAMIQTAQDKIPG